MSVKIISLIIAVAIVLSAVLTAGFLEGHLTQTHSEKLTTQQTTNSTLNTPTPNTSTEDMSSTPANSSIPIVSYAYVGVYNYSVYVVTSQPFSSIRVLNHTFVRGGPMMVPAQNDQGFIAVINSPSLAQEVKVLNQVQVVIYVNGSPQTLTLPVKVLTSPLNPTAEFYPPTGPIPV
ncbi:hypothetical protein [Stygiolobus caldivivus]|uniref:Uncharacterized protein n=1 Tax=Stygiolobus caldivivus TaxID=2824673 RepID=A0A8D5U5I5_9CREN|nr:hypothetical protein [Stygiolobus caldivivus]BCU69925.1 hypothetical protein KN1_12220 [Stygiolobus caldivivus]